MAHIFSTMRVILTTLKKQSILQFTMSLVLFCKNIPSILEQVPLRPQIDHLEMNAHVHTFTVQ